MKAIPLLLLLLTSVSLGLEPPKELVGESEPPPSTAPRIEGIWYKDAGKGHYATKWFGQGHVAVTVYDQKSGEVTSHHEGTWVMDDHESVERVLVTTKNWEGLRGKLFRSDISFPNSNTLRQVFSDGNVEIWKKVP